MPRLETLVKQSLIRPTMLFVSAALAAFALAGCAKNPTPAPAPEAAPAPVVDTAAADAAKAADEARAAELAAREKALADREAVLKQQEIAAELARRDAENTAAEREKAAKAAAAKKTSTRTAAATGAAAAGATAAAKSAKPAEPPKPIVVPAGTQLAIQVNTALSSKTTREGDRVDGTLSSDVVVGGRKAALAGAAVTGSVSKVTSGSSGVGKTPKLSVIFDKLVASNGATIPIAAKYQQEGQSEKGQDTAKIVGGAAIGAIIGNQVSHSGGSVIGGVLGAGAGTAIANKTGSEVAIPAGTVIAVATNAEFEVKPK